MTAAENIALVQRFYDEGWNANNVAVYDELVTEDFLDHQSVPGMGPSGPPIEVHEQPPSRVTRRPSNVVAQISSRVGWKA